ncbi:MAG TPA: hypothetical protein ENJ00_02010 [Phycisphaerales bacterium]|nr:hypothetical protein [Phycisphaerales bacterium]
MNTDTRGMAYALLTVAGLISIAMVVIGMLGLGREAPDEGLVNLGLIGLVVVGGAGGIVLAIPAGESRGLDEDRIVQEMAAIKRSLDRLSQQSALSDDARRVLNRSRERELLCRAIEEDLRVQDWEAAQVLCTELASRFGYEQDAERFRMRIEMARAEGLDTEINEAIGRLDEKIVQRDWEAALAEADSIAKRYPVSPRVRGLRDRVLRARTQYKEELERRFLLAAQAEQVDEAMEILTELDHYLTEQEAEPFREVARGVIGKAKENLGAAFKLACQDRQWGLAAGVGRQIIEQFPNSRMAQEVSGLLAELDQRAMEEV